jgi:predicted  nucleic acid-binding Zn-ribbon protein
MTDVSQHFQRPEGSNSDSLPDSSAGGSEYRQLRRKYLQLEDHGFALGEELKEAEDQVKTLEEEKIALLDQLVVMEGLVNPSEIHS